MTLYFVLFLSDSYILNKMLQKNFKSQNIRDGPWPDATRPDPTRAYFWPAVKRPTWLWPGYFPTRPEAIFFIWREKNEKFDVFRGNFQNSNPNHKWLTRPDPSHKKLTRPGSKIFDPDPSLQNVQLP